MSHEQAVEIIREGRGKHFDPDICDAFLANAEQFRGIATQFADSDQDMATQLALLEQIADQP
jgi:putative two-component system response regulator